LSPSSPPESPKSSLSADLKKDGKVLVSSGALHSPLLLLKSGIGQREDLDKFNVGFIKEFCSLSLNVERVSSILFEKIILC